MTAIAPLTSSITVNRAHQDAFREFTDGFGSWWPPEFSWSQPDLLCGMGMDCRIGGLLSEIGPHDFRIDFGRIIAWNPPSSLEFLWQISAERVPVPDPDQASAVLVSFVSQNDGASVTVEHHSWERHGAEGQKYRDGFQEAWPMALDRFRQHLQN